MKIVEIIVLALYTFSLSILLLFSFGQLVLIYFYTKSAKTKNNPQKQLFKELPIITIQLPVYNEVYVIERLIKAVCEINYPKNSLEIQVLDDSDDETTTIAAKLISEYQQKGVDVKLIHRNSKTGFKAGALQNGLKQCKGDFIAIFDADFLPSSTILKDLIHEFIDDNIGMVQSRWSHLNEDISLLTKIQAFGLDGHFSVEQQGRYAGNLFMNFNGTAGIWRKTCIEDAGGWQHDTLTEDLDLSYRAQLKGWKFKYLEAVVTPAELPININAYKSQQHRWTKGAVETSIKIWPLIRQSEASFKQKVFGFLHLFNAYAFVLILLTCLLSIPVVIIKSGQNIYNQYFNIMSVFLIGFIVMILFYFTSWRKRKTSIIGFILRFPGFLAISMAMSLHNSIAVLEGVFKIKTDFIRTPKFNSINKTAGLLPNKYLHKNLPITFFIELLCFMLFSFGFVYGILNKDYGLLLFHLLLSFGFGTLCFYGLKHRKVV